MIASQSIACSCMYRTARGGFCRRNRVPSIPFQHLEQNAVVRVTIIGTLSIFMIIKKKNFKQYIFLMLV
jgi:hypothetical protein